MAELGDYVCQGKRKNVAVDVDMMDYAYVDKCDDVPLLRTILTELRSGKHGKYPHLEQHTEKRIMDLLPAKDRRKVEALRQKPTPADEMAASQEIKAFEASTKDADDRLRTEVYVAAGGKASKHLPPVRGKKAEEAPLKRAPKRDPDEPLVEEVSKENAAERIPGYDFRGWDKFDVDAECEKVDAADKAAEAARAARARAARERDEAKARKALADLAAERDKLGADDLAPAERTFLATREKNKGNEAYRANEARDAFDCYTRSLAYDPSSPVVFANRAMACLRLGLLERAEDDCTCALRLDATYHKARQRRGMTRHKRGKYALAIEDFERAVGDDPDNAPLRKMLQQACDKFEEVEGEKARLKSDPATFVSVAIDDDDDDDDDDLKPGATFTKIAIADEDSSDEDEVLEAGADGFELPDPAEAEALARLAADDGDQFPVDELEAEDVPISTGTKVAIADESDEEDVPISTGTGAGTKVAIDDASDEDAPVAAGTKVAIDDDDDDEPVYAGTTTPGTKIAIEESDDDDDEPPAFEATPPAVAVDEPEPSVSSHSSPTSQESWEVVAPPADAEALKAEGNALMQRGDRAGAAAKYDAALAADAGHYASRANRAFARLKLGDAAGCVADCAACLDHPLAAADASKRAKALFRRGDARSKLAEGAAGGAKVELLREAAADLDAIYALEPANETASKKRLEVRTALQAATAEAGAADARQKDLDAFAKSDEAKARGSDALGRGDLEEAEKAYTEALDAWAGNRAARNNRALVRLKRDDFAGCAADASDVLKAEPDNLKALYRRGVARRATGDLGGSLDDLDALLRLAPGDRAATAERDATRRKMDERDGVTRKKTKGVVALNAAPRAPPALKPSSKPKKPVVVETADAPPPPPPAPRPRVAKAPEATGKVATGAIAAAKLRHAVKAKAPKTATELERAWRDRKGDADAWGEYLKTFKATTLKKIDLSLCPDVFCDVIAGLEAALGADAAGLALGNAAKAKSFSVTKALLGAAEAARVAAIADGMADAEAAAALKAAYA